MPVVRGRMPRGRFCEAFPGSSCSSPKGRELQGLRKQESAESSVTGSGKVAGLKDALDSPTHSNNSPVH